ncbi:MAG: SpoIIE family protein phosphatase [Leptospiraceae bacterium]|nr:SpoIIE family protein phosphatase [Leptospiraceae bacterium]
METQWEKSIQGAGGALALGVVFKSIISRGKIFSQEETVFPERWLKLAFQELQSIFESFDGSMMVSVVMGLVDNDRGFIYYINAEHPFCVLFRDKKATFIEKEMNLHKIGMMTAEHSGDFRINTFKLENGDIVLMGSDGKDDIKIGIDDRGGRHQRR